MSTSRPYSHTAWRLGPGLAAILALAALLPRTLDAQQGPATGSREATWPAPTAEDWARPCLVTWQRSYDDALALSRETGKPVLVCINMDGEIASEHYAGVRYRQPEIAALYEPYVCVIASVYRHTPRDYDNEGRRSLCPRFGSVTCGEHIAIEPGLFQRFMDDRRIAPRHIGVELDGQEMYDVYYAWDTETIFDSLRDGIEQRGDVPVRELAADRGLHELASSPDSRDQARLEADWLSGNRALREALLEAAMAAGEHAPVDLLRLAILGSDVELAARARRALVQSSSEKAVDVLVEALRDPLAEDETEALLAALERLGSSSPRAATLAVVHRGLKGAPGPIDPAAWLAALGGREPTPPAEDSERLARQDELLGSEDPAELLDLAESFLAAAYEQPETERDSTRWLLEDARTAARRAADLGALGWRVQAALSIAAYYLGEISEARSRAEQALASGLPGEAGGWDSLAVLTIFAQGRREAIAAAVAEKREWPAQWVTDVHTACTILDRHPLGDASLIEGHYDFLRSLGAAGEAARVLDQGLKRFPGEPGLHSLLRRRLLADEGIDALQSRYADMLARSDDSTSLPWFAGLASFVAAEFQRRAGRDAEADANYDRAMALFEDDVRANPDSRAEADHQIALALAGRARLALERGDGAAALAGILASFERCPDAAATLDGLNISPVDTARMLLAHFMEQADTTSAATLEAALRELDPQLLRLPAYEQDLPADDQQGRRRPGWRRGTP